MSGLRHPIPEQTRSRQAEAADPGKSVWVSANAGSGKTYVLARRVIRLLLGGADPSRILCLTYTRSAAANMALRVFGDLAAWSTLPDAKLREQIAALEGAEPDDARLRAARRLFARALETPGGLKIQTIHAFCEAVLHQFPLEANIAGHFELIDEQVQAGLLAEARRDLLAAAARDADSDLGKAWLTVIALGGESGFDALLNEIVDQRTRIEPLLAAMRAEGGPDMALRRMFSLGAGENAAAIVGATWPDAYFTADRAMAIRDVAESAGKKGALEFATSLLDAMAMGDARTRFERLCGAFLTVRDKAPAPRMASRIASKGVAEHFPGLGDEFLRCAEILLAAQDRLALLEMIEASAAAMVLAERLIGRYERAKRSHGYLDFADLIARTAMLLSRPEAGSWVQYKLDRGLDHILIDEAQDTSPDQWQVVRKLAEEFFAGAGARGALRRTLFAVGDEKQSIYSFQGAEPAAFAETGMEFSRRITGVEARFERVHLRHSFRSVPAVLSAVDRVFASERARGGLTLYPEEIEHPAIRSTDPGEVEVWPQFAAERSVEPEDWTEAIDHASLPAVRLAEAMARRIAGWLASGEILAGRGRRIRPGDIMVLVRKRDSFVHALSRSLKERNVAVAGADRLRLSDHIAVKDLIALGRFVLQPEDDLSLAALLRSPVFGFTDDDLFAIAHGRGNRSLWRSLLRASVAGEKFRAAAGQLSRWRTEAGFATVHAFYASVLGRDGVRAALLARLGSETSEILDEFIGFILACERTGPIGLGAFLEMLEHSAPEIKREIAQARDEVRIMTVHAAKGLEAPIVFLVDNGSRPFSASHLPRLLAWKPGAGRGAPQCFLWRAGRALQNTFSRQLEAEYGARQEEEYRRLLYVGMTRAEDRLIVCGYHGLRQPDDGTWHRLVTDALTDAPETRMQFDDLLQGQIHRYAVTPPSSRVELAAEPPVVAAAEAEEMPEWLAPLPAEAGAPLPLAPSRLEEIGLPEPVIPGESPVLGARPGGNFAAERGAAIHRLLQFLPGIERSRRDGLMRAYLARFGAGWPEDEHEEICHSVAAILDDRRFADLFDEDSQAEVALGGYLSIAGRQRSISGRIDRLRVVDDRVLFVDFKTGRHPPATVEAIAPAHLSQVALYAALLRKALPGQKIAAGLLYTVTPVLLAIPEEQIDTTLEHLAVT